MPPIALSPSAAQVIASVISTAPRVRSGSFPWSCSCGASWSSGFVLVPAGSGPSFKCQSCGAWHTPGPAALFPFSHPCGSQLSLF